MALSSLSRERMHGLVFIVLAAIVLLFSLFSTPLTQHAELVTIAALIVVFGVPHGALDPLFAKALLPLGTATRWAVFVLFYLLLASLVVVFWWSVPFLFFLFFLAYSVFHFSGDLAPGTPAATRVLYGGACIVLPAALHAAQLGEIFTYLVGPQRGVELAEILHVLAWPWLAALCLASLQHYQRDWLTALEILAVSGLALILSPLLGFTLFFCGMHSARHIIRTQRYANISFSGIVKVSALPMFSLAAIVMLSWVVLPESAVDARIIQFIFVGLAALTVPHMVLVERIRFKGW